MSRRGLLLPLTVVALLAACSDSTPLTPVQPEGPPPRAAQAAATCTSPDPATIQAQINAKERLRQDVQVLATIVPPARNARNVASLDQSAEYILAEFRKTVGRVELQRFTDDGKEYKNVICSFGPHAGERIIVGAHYDVQGDQPGADDNASGVSGLLELSWLITSLKPELQFRVDFVAFTLEEGQLFKHPFARHYGSYIHARSLAHAGVSVHAMLCLEMIRYFTDHPGSQRYPLPFLRWFYPDPGNFIAVVGKWGQGWLVQ